MSILSMYPVLLPLLFFVLIFHFLWHKHPGTDWRAAFLSVAIIWGVITTATTEFLNLFNALTLGPLVLCWGAMTLGALTLAVRHISMLRALAHWRLQRPSLVTLTISVPIVMVLLTTGFIAIVGWPNQWDTMVYHLSRVDHWGQNESVAFYPTHIVRQLSFPPWAEYAILHLTWLGGDERFANLPQWFSMLGSLIGVSLIAQRLGASPRGQLFSALFCSLIPMGILQSSGTQNDYVPAFWLVCLTDTLLVMRSKSASVTQTIKAGASLGLAFLTKGSAYIFVGPLLLVLPFMGQISRTANVLRQGILILAVALALNTPHYFRNLDTFGFPLGPRNLGSATEVNDNLTNDAFTLPILLSNLVRNIALHVGTPWPTVNSAVENVIERWHIWLGIDVNDPRSTRLYPEKRFAIVGTLSSPDRTGNPLHLLLIALAILATVTSRRARYNGVLRRYSLALLLSFILFSLLLKWQPWHSRLLLPLFVLWSPVVGVIYEYHTKMLVGIALLMTVQAQPPLMSNYLHPLVGERSIVRTTRLQQYFPFRPNIQAEYVGAADFMRSRDCAKVGLLTGWDDYEHPLWVLLPELSAGRGRLEHVGVTNSSAQLEDRWPAFTPCAVVAINKPTDETVDIGRRSYHLAWSSGRMKVFLADADALP